MLSDPLVSVYNPTYVAPTGGTPVNFRRVSQGRYVSIDSPFSLDQQARYSVTPTIKPVGYSTLRTRYEVDKNVALNVLQPANVPADDTLTVDQVIKYNPRSHSFNDVLVALDAQYLINRTNLVRLMAGES